MGGDVVGDDAGIVGYVNDDCLLLVGVCFDSDESMLVFWYFSALFLLDCLHGILQKIGYDMGDDALVGIDDKVFWRKLNAGLMIP